MKCIYHKHQTTNSYWSNEYWDHDYYLCDTEEEYQQKRKEYEARQAADRSDYEKRGYSRYAPTLSKEKEIHAKEYYYAHEWTGKNFDAIGFTYTEYDERGSRATHILKPGSVTNESPADNSGCVGWMYGS